MMLLTMTAAKATQLFTATAGRNAELRPRLVDAGPQAGKYVLNPAVRTDPAFSYVWSQMTTLTQAEIDPATAWPVA